MATKVCTKCRTSYPATPEFFHRHRLGLDGLQPRCKTCRNEDEQRRHAGAVGERERRKQRWQSKRKAVLTRYCGGQSPSCHCCGENHIEFLQLDHLNGDGSEHRRQIGVGGDRLWRWAEANGYPATLQVLCCNCNWAKSRYGQCPHKK